jgi:hypothetical protein
MLYLMGFTDLFFRFASLNKVIPISFGLNTNTKTSSSQPFWIACAQGKTEIARLKHPIMDYLLVISVITEMLSDVLACVLPTYVTNSMTYTDNQNTFPVITYDISKDTNTNKLESFVTEFNPPEETFVKFSNVELKQKIDMFINLIEYLNFIGIQQKFLK